MNQKPLSASFVLLATLIGIILAGVWLEHRVRGKDPHEASRYNRTYVRSGKQLRCAEQSREYRSAASTLHAQGVIYRDKGNYRLSDATLKRAISAALQVDDPDHKELAGILEDIGKLYCEVGLIPEAESYLWRAVSIRRRSTDYESLSSALCSLANAYRAQKKYDVAVKIYQRAIDANNGQKRSDVRRMAYELQCLADLYVAKHDYARAKALSMQSLKMCQDRYGTNHESTYPALYQLSCIHCECGDYPAARRLSERVLAGVRQGHGTDEPRYASYLVGAARIDARMNDCRSAEAKLEVALAVTKKACGIESTDVASVLDDYSAILKSAGRHVRSDRLKLQCENIRRKAMSSCGT